MGVGVGGVGTVECAAHQHLHLPTAHPLFNNVFRPGTKGEHREVVVFEDGTGGGGGGGGGGGEGRKEGRKGSATVWALGGALEAIPCHTNTGKWSLLHPLHLVLHPTPTPPRRPCHHRPHILKAHTYTL